MNLIEAEEYAKKWNELCKIRNENNKDPDSFQEIHSDKWIYNFKYCEQEDGSLNFDNILLSKFYKKDRETDKLTCISLYCCFDNDYLFKLDGAPKWQLCILSNNEGEVCDNTVWFNERNDQGAILTWMSANNY